MKKIMVALLFVSCTIINAQNIGINATGTPPNASAGLDIDFSNKGVLIPRVALTSANVTIPSPATSLLIYNTGSGGLTPSGFYYWDGSQWLQLGTASSGNGFSNMQVYNTPGTYTFIVPAGVTKIMVEIWGGGGGGGSCMGSGAGGGGGGGGYGKQIFTVTPFTSYTVVVGSGGSGGISNGNGNSGGMSSFGTLISASGGNGGASCTNGGGGGSGGTSSATFNISGGKGGNGTTLGEIGKGGNGANGGSSNISPGGGGDGNTGGNGFNGASGRVVVWW
jgi:hypothetical protein